MSRRHYKASHLAMFLMADRDAYENGKKYTTCQKLSDASIIFNHVCGPL